MTVQASALQADGTIAPDQLYSPKQAAQILGISPRSLERWRSDGKGPKVTLLFKGAAPKHRGRDILRFIEAGGAADPPAPA